MNCPHCATELTPKTGRFCDVCGLSVRGPVREDPEEAKGDDEEAETVRCPACGMPARPPLCRACYTRLPSADDE